MTIKIPDLSVVVLIGSTGSGKSTFARKHFLPTEILSSDACRGMVSDDENSQEATNDAFDLLYTIAEKRLARRKLVVIDATNVQQTARKRLISLAKQFHVVAVAVVLDMPMSICYERNRGRADRQFGDHVVKNHSHQLRSSLRGLEKEGFRYVHVFRSPEELEEVEFQREPLWTDRRSEHGPFDIIGDVHGCYDELMSLLGELGWTVADEEITGPEGRKVVLLGDLVDRGPRSVDCLKLAMRMKASGQALVVPGNHDVKLLRAMQKRKVTMSHGLAETWEQVTAETPESQGEMRQFLDTLISHYLLDDGNLVVAHAGMKEEYAGRASGTIREFAMYGETTGETDEFGFLVRHNWAAEYRGTARVVYGHTPVLQPEWINGTLNIDTGCAFGGRMTALRYPEMELVSVPALLQYADPIRPIGHGQDRSSQQTLDDVLDLQDVIGKRLISTQTRGNITIQEENAIAALETMSRFAANPKWLVYLPPTMSPTETSHREDLLEHPDEAFAYYRNAGAKQVVCEEKHMGSRAVVIVCKDESAAQRRFGVNNEGFGTILTRTGRPFFEDKALETQFLERVRVAATPVFEQLNSDWLLLDCELMPWSAKAMSLLREQYAAVGASAQHATRAAVELLKGAPEVEGLAGVIGRIKDRAIEADKFVDAYRRYCWTVTSIEDYKVAPFHIMASEGAVHTDKDHLWHMAIAAEMSALDPSFILATQHRLVDLNDEVACQEAADWWTQLTASGGEGMVVKPLSFILQDAKGLAQPAVKCRGREYLRIIYGPEYTAPANLSRLRQRGVGRKRSLAMREFALGLEGLQRFTAGEPLRRVHECIFGVLALESEPVDPRL